MQNIKTQQPEKEDVLVTTLRYVLQFGMTMSALSQHYGLRRSTIVIIGQGYRLTKKRQWYLRQFIKALDDMRQTALLENNAELVAKLNNAIAEVCHVSLREE